MSHAQSSGSASAPRSRQPIEDQLPADQDTIVPTDERPELTITGAAHAADWLRAEAGRGPLAGIFRRSGLLVHTPREDEDGYVPLAGDGDHDGGAQIRAVTPEYLAAQIQYRYSVRRAKVRDGQAVDGESRAAMFPVEAARVAVHGADMLQSVRPLTGVIHTPIMRADGTLLDTPGYDAESRLLYLPRPGFSVDPVPEEPTADDVTAARNLIDYIIGGFPFLREHDRANFIGMWMTPLLRAIVPPPYKLYAIEAHQPGSGKTLLANVIRRTYEGLLRSEMPEDDTELRKQITSVLSMTTGPVVVFDNVTGLLRSSTMAGLLTSDRWDDRPLGSTQWTTAANDRLWIITGNNLAIGGDLPRRTIRSTIDPGRPNPEQRTGFAITDLESWVDTHRARIIHALLTLIRHWVAEGMPLPDAGGSDSYATWIQVVRGILLNASIPGQFDHQDTRVETGTEDDEWGAFLHSLHECFSDQSWTAAEALTRLDQMGQDGIDMLPGELAEKASRSPQGARSQSRSLGRWLANRQGRWAGGMTVRHVGDRKRALLWRVEVYQPEH